MKLILEKINYKGEHFNKVVFDLPQKYELDELFEERIIPYITEQLDILIKDRKES